MALPIYLDSALVFPNPALADGFEPLAIGGDLSAQRLLLAYASGIFPWQDNPIVWYSPDPRAVLFLEDFKLSKSLQKSIRNKGFTLRIDEGFADVISACAKRTNGESTWISAGFVEAYTRLFDLGIAHSFGIFQGDSLGEERLVGGLYGVSLGGAFMGESMFARVSDASKVAMYYLVEFCKAHKFDFIDAQIQNPYLQTLGVREIPRKKYLKMLRDALTKPTLQGKWHNF